MAKSLVFVVFLLLLYLIPFVNTHGLMSWPRQRGLIGKNNYGLKQLKPDAPVDYCPHCLNGGGTASVASHSPRKIWTPYEPTNPAFRFRDDHGLCGDPLGATQPHMAPHGQFLANFTQAIYEQGDYIDFEIHVSAHHNGFFEFFACNLDCCKSDDISKRCFTNGCCKKLMRVPHKSCESGWDRICGPVDPIYPGRWYLPPRNEHNPEDNWCGGLNKKMRYALPTNMRCERCVIHWAWTTANSCNPPGYTQYKFPQKWNGLPGDGGSTGGINRSFMSCGHSPAQFPEEFWSCSENVRIVTKNDGKSRTLQHFHNGEMNIEGPADVNSDQLLPPMDDPHTGPTSPVQNNAEPSGDSHMTVAASPSISPGAGGDGPSEETGRNRSQYDVYAYVKSFDTGMCLTMEGGQAFCEACLDLGYGTRKCLWCSKDETGREHCLHERPTV